MYFDYFHDESRFREAWQSVQIVRPVPYGLFTFGESVLPYYLVCEAEQSRGQVSIDRGEVRITRPLIITAENAPPELSNFFEDESAESTMRRLLARTASFRHLRLNNVTGSRELVSQSVEETAARITQRLDDEQEDDVAVLTAPSEWAGMAVLRYAAERVMDSAADNVQELRERGFLP